MIRHDPMEDRELLQRLTTDRSRHLVAEAESRGLIETDGDEHGLVIDLTDKGRTALAE